MRDPGDEVAEWVENWKIQLTINRIKFFLPLNGNTSLMLDHLIVKLRVSDRRMFWLKYVECGSSSQSVVPSCGLP